MRSDGSGSPLVTITRWSSAPLQLLGSSEPGMKRYVTGVDDEGRSYFVSEDVIRPPEPGVDVWRYEPSDIAHWVAAISDEAAAAAVEPPPGGAWWGWANFPPGEDPIGVGMPGVDENGFHTTRTIDFIYVLSGTLVLQLDRGFARLTPGDTVVMQATRHAWRNGSSTESASMISLLHSPVRPNA